MENLSEALQLLVIGVLTVFVILLIVIGLGKLLIALVNKYAPEEVTAKKAAPAAPAAVDGQTRSIIQAAIDQLTGGKGTVTKIQKL